MASAALVAVDTVFVLGDAFITMASDALSGLSIVLGGIREWANVMSFVSLAIPGIGGQVSAAWESLSTGADNAKTSVDGLKTGFDIAGNGIKTAMSGGRQSIDALKNAVDAANAKRIQLRVDTDSVATARETIASLTKTRYAYVNIITRKGAIGSGAFARPAYSDGNLFAPNSAAPQVNVFLQDERLSDLIGVTVDGQNVATQQTELRRWGAPI